MTTSRTRVPATAAVLAAGALLLGGCGTAFGGPSVSDRGSERFGAVSRVEVDAGSGTVRVRSGPAGSAEVDRELRWRGDERPRVTQEVRGGVLRVVATCPDGADDCETDLVVTVPAASTVRATLDAGNVTVAGLSGALELTTDAGNVGGTGLGAAPVTATTSAGNIDLGFAAAPPTVDARSDAGDVTVRVPPGAPYDVDAGSSAGGATVGVPDTPGAPHRITARSSAGTVAVQPG